MPHYGESMAAISRPCTGPQTVTPGASPYVYTATQAGLLIVSAGTVTSIELGRGGVYGLVGLLAGIVPVSIGDLVRITYVVAPTIKFLGN